MSGLRVDIRRKIYPGRARPALEGLRFTAAAGEILAIVGPSGAGKSTLLHIIAGLDRLVDGVVEIDGESPRCNGSSTISMGMMFQTSRLMPWLTILDNVRLVLGQDPASTAQARQLIRDVGLEEVEALFPRQLSEGMQRRVALARAFAVRPRLLLLDEPLVSLDAPTASRLRRYLFDLWQETRPTVLYVTHELREALAVADRVLFLSSGPARVVAEVPVDLPRPREPGDPGIGSLHDRVLAAHPELLAGLANDDHRPSGTGTT
ncbi:MAG TPA: ABC transporter ATP-binding protein [Candidatus Methylomirabilis sp.]|nr:ABC transporter ATP-binding protein [Candidatus Methylomirabilis sp.]